MFFFTIWEQDRLTNLALLPNHQQPRLCVSVCLSVSLSWCLSLCVCVFLSLCLSASCVSASCFLVCCLCVVCDVVVWWCVVWCLGLCVVCGCVWLCVVVCGCAWLYVVLTRLDHTGVCLVLCTNAPNCGSHVAAHMLLGPVPVYRAPK